MSGERRQAEIKALHDIAALGRAPHEWQSYEAALWQAAAGNCRKCKGHGLIAGDDADGVFFDTCPKCKGTGFSSVSPQKESPIER
jgi:hypothetical protein